MSESTSSVRARFGDRSLFPLLGARSYLNHAAVGPPSSRVCAAVRAQQDAFASQGAAAWMPGMAQRERVKVKLAQLLSVDPKDLALMPSTTRAISDLARCFPWRPGDRILGFEGEFLTNVTPWRVAAEGFGASLVLLPLGGFRGPSVEAGLAELERELRRGVRLVAVSAVQFSDGLAMPLAAMARLCHQYGAELAVDAMQAVGNLPLNLTELGVDYAAGGSHKWMFGPDGAGFLYVRPDRLAGLVQRVAGWLSHEGPPGFLFPDGGPVRYDVPLRRSIDWLEVGAAHGLAFAGWEAGIDMVAELGVPQIRAYTQEYHDRIEGAFVELGAQSLRSPDPTGRSAILSFRLKQPLTPVFRSLNESGVAVSTPAGLLRLSPHWPNSFDEIPEVVAALARAIEA